MTDLSWTLDQDLSVNYSTERFMYFSGSLYASVSQGGIWERDTDGTWVQRRVASTTYHQNAISWNGYLWHFDDDEIYRSSDGTNWTVDQNMRTLDSDSSFVVETINCNTTHLYVSGIRRASLGGDSSTRFYERDTDGNWSLSSCSSPGAGKLTDDFLHFGSYYYYVAGGSRVYRWTGAAWEAVPDTEAYPCWFTVYDSSTAYVKMSKSAGIDKYYIYWVNGSTDAWTLITTGSDTYTSHYGRISIGGDDNLYYAVHNTNQTLVYYKDASISAPASGWERISITSTDEGSTAGHDAGSYICFGTAEASAKIYESTFDTSPYPIGPDPAGASRKGLPNRSLAVDGDGDILYLALYDGSNNPKLDTVALPLNSSTSTATVRYNPGAGDSINVASHYEVGEFSIISGYFGNNEQARRSEDGGATYSDVDPGTWGTNRAQPLAIDPNDYTHALVTLDSNNDLVEKDSADSWTTLDAALTFVVSALAIFDLEPDEIFIGNTAAAASLVRYSPNNGSTWSDITGALPVTAGIANIEVV